MKMKRSLILTIFCVTLVFSLNTFAQHFVDGQMPDTFLAGHTDYVNSVAFSPDGTTLASGSRDATVKLWDVATGTLKATLEGHTGSVRNVAFSPDGNTIASGAGDYIYRDGVRDATIKLWDVATGTLKATLAGHTGPVNSVAFSPDGNTIASGSSGSFYYNPPAHGDFTITRGTIKLWDVATGTLKTTLGRFRWMAESVDTHSGVGRSYRTIYDVTFSPDAKTIASTHRDYRIVSHGDTHWNATRAATESLGVFLRAQLAVDAHGSMPFRSRMIDDDHVTETYRDVINLWDVASGAIKATLEGHTGSVNSVAFSPDGNTIASGSSDDTVKLWDVSRPFQPRVPKATLSNHGNWVSSVAFSPDGTRLASSCSDGVVRLWNALPLGNDDGVVNIADLVEVAQNFGQIGENNADINGDGIVNVVDLILVAVALGEVPGAPAARAQVFSMLTAEEVSQWLIEAERLQTEDPIYLRGILMLEQLLMMLKPKETVLLANYPNPFNPETWIPYQLAGAADVSLTLYDINGRAVRTLDLGYQHAGVYQSRSRAAYWDGKNELGESVASGLYFYTFTAGDFTATRKMLIRK